MLMSKRSPTPVPSARSRRKLLARRVPPGRHVVVLEEPYVSGIYEECSVQRSGYGEAVFDVGFELECARSVEIIFGLSFGSFVAARAYGAHREGSHGVCSAHIELLGVWHLIGVAVGVSCTTCHACVEPVVAACYTVSVDELRLSFDEL